MHIKKTFNRVLEEIYLFKNGVNIKIIYYLYTYGLPPNTHS